MLDVCLLPKPEVRKWALSLLNDEIGVKVPAGLPDLKQLGATLKRQKADVLAYFDHAGSSNGSTETLNRRLHHLRGIAPGFRNLAHTCQTLRFILRIRFHHSIDRIQA